MIIKQIHTDTISDIIKDILLDEITAQSCS